MNLEYDEEWKEVLVRDLDSIQNKDFKNEKELQDHLEKQIEVFCKEVLEDTYIKHEKEFMLKYDFRHRRNGKKEFNRLQPRGRRIDLLIECEKHNYIVELKNSRTGSEVRYAIGQVLDYGRELNDKCKLVILSTFLDFNTTKTIEHYNLPIKFIYYSKDKAMIFKQSINVLKTDS